MKTIKTFFVFWFFLQTSMCLYPAKDRFSCVRECCLWSFLFREKTKSPENHVELTERFNKPERPSLVIQVPMPSGFEVPQQGTPRHYIQQDPNPMAPDQSALSSPSHASTQPMHSVESLTVMPVPLNSPVASEHAGATTQNRCLRGSPGSTKSPDSTFEALQISSKEFHHADSDDPKKGWDVIDDSDL